MSSQRRLAATFDEVTPLRDGDRVGVELGFRVRSVRAERGRIEDFADLGPELTVPAVSGVGKVLRILRAARLVQPADPLTLLGQECQTSRLLERALGTPLLLEVRTRTRLRFVAWTEAGVQTVHDVSDVVESEDAYFVMRRGGRYPVRVPRASVVRRSTELERWYEVLDIARA